MEGKCQCENARHFWATEADAKRLGLGHKYGAQFPNLRRVKTEYSTLQVCRICAEDCLGSYSNELWRPVERSK